MRIVEWKNVNTNSEGCGKEKLRPNLVIPNNLPQATYGKDTYPKSRKLTSRTDTHTSIYWHYKRTGIR